MMMKELSLQNCRLDSRYDIQTLLGRGSYAEIYLARDRHAAPNSPHHQVVIKALNVFLQNDLDADLERTLVENFQNEAIALDRVRHPNIISRLGHGTARDLRGTIFHYLVLEYMPGGDLAQVCRQKSLNFAEALNYLEQVCAGLGHAHKSGVIHRDIKPQNLLLTEDRKVVKIADFGVARFSASDSPITRVGTNIFAPPEHSPLINDEGVLTVTELTPAADVYSLAKSAYVLITCESPRFFTNQPISELPFDMRQKPWANDLLRVLRKATQNNPKDRYQTVLEFWQELSAIKSAADADEGETLTEISTRPHTIPQAYVAKGYSPLAPTAPKFNTSRDLKLKNLGIPAIPAADPRLVVRIGEAAPPAPIQPKTIEQNNSDLLKTYVDEESAAPRRKNSFLRRAAVLLLLLSVFAGALFVTQNYMRTGRYFPAVGTPVGTANNDVNIRPSAGTEGSPIGILPKGSRVRIVNSKDNWYEIDVVEFSRPKESSTDAERGWVNKRFIDVEN
jgi:serine/threonine protein kinase